MTTEEKKLFNTFETQVRHLIFLHNEAREEIANLQEQLLIKEQEKKVLEAQYDELQTRYNNLKNAATISLNGSDVRETKSKLAQLVREVDKCIALLNE